MREHDAFDDTFMVEEVVCLNFLEGITDRLLAEGTANLLEGIEGSCRVCDEVHVGEAALVSAVQFVGSTPLRGDARS